MMCASLQSVASGIDLAGDHASLEVQDDDLRESRLFEFCTPPSHGLRSLLAAGRPKRRWQLSCIYSVPDVCFRGGIVGLFQSSAPIQSAI